MSSDGSRWRTLAADLRRGIVEGRYPVDSRLPSIRQAAREHKMAANTVQTALDQLVAEGLVEKRHGSGHWVVRTTPQVGIADRLAAVEQEQAELRERIERLERDRHA